MDVRERTWCCFRHKHRDVGGNMGELGVSLGTVVSWRCARAGRATLFSRCTPLNSEANIFLIVSSRYFRIRSAWYTRKRESARESETSFSGQ